MLGLSFILHYILVHTQPFYQGLGFTWGGVPEAERYYAEAISLPLYFGLTESAQDRVVAVLWEVLW
ncbi:DegT/DnrJ/EryC1/StrS family aminotransferase [Phormidium yuhuli AB48]|uniref:DegT/DnrJ/EryC1/StrS family aminotransferase n=1 Tax=Phormidium yuhuli AB48 TaxID=2940671 RepID=A0ABY5AM46_9CYAN|nr:DegT/DnrJ/EryC1/StrS family aminotransferase [Phormidium yuhuli]USR89902.1 DegT/DnrJ/EryC1/StrS family aminotransferase [Phormidium yuhuli AB48]